MFMTQLSMQTIVTLLPLWEVSSTSLPNSMTSDLIIDPLLLLAPFKTEVMKSENNTIEISYRLSVIVLVSKREN